jgi:ribosomal protein S18 acetylase RimI-like enzyme
MNSDISLMTKHRPLIDSSDNLYAGMPVSFRRDPRQEDLNNVSKLLSATGFFSLDEIVMAIELLVEHLHRGPDSGYEFLFAEQAGRFLGYSCFGAIPCTQHSFDLYWIAVDPKYQGNGTGKMLLSKTEALVCKIQGKRLYIETSARPLYEPTRAFYRRCGYRQEAFLKDFYASGDGKIIYSKLLESTEVKD